MGFKKIFVFLLLIICVFITFAQDLFEGKDYSLSEQWDLNDLKSGNKGLFVIKKYKPLYVLPLNIISDVNEMPYSDNPERNPTTPQELDNAELKFQLSFKTKVLTNLLGKKYGGDLWIGYTQSSRWQLFNYEQSRPFRETNYEPELMFILPVNYQFLGLDGVFMGLGINHQSNGRGNPYSRSWNRIIAEFAWEGKHSSIMFKPWLRLQETSDEDDNPGIENYMGRGELLFAYGKGLHNFSCIARHSMRFGDNNRGSIQLDYAIQIWDHLKFHTQFFSGYGESMIDYNHKQTTFGFGFSLVEWR